MAIKCPKCNTENPAGSKYCRECAAPLPSREEIVVTETLETPTEKLTRGSVFASRYEIIEELGKGGMGKVYRVEDKKINEEVALKLIKPEIASDKKTIERFSNELKMARKIAHRNVCRMYDLGVEKGTYYITMEYVPGEDLRSLIRRVKQLTFGTAVSIAKQVCEGLSEAHRLGVVHRDLKPQNIMIDKEGNARIMDFGIARSVKGKGITDAGVMVGTPEYMSPEQAEVKDVDQRSDIYSLGVILYEMVTGRVPFEGETPLGIAMRHKSEEPKAPKELNAQIPEDLNLAILKCMEKAKENRYQSAGELHSELAMIEKEIPTTDREFPKRKPATSREITVTLNLRKFLVPALVIGVFAVAVVAVLLFFPWRKEGLSISSSQPSIAVLPFEDLSPNKDQEHFCDGMTDEIIAKLSRLEGWKVIPRTSVMQYREKEKAIKEIGQDLDVAHVLDGSIRKEEDDIRVTVTLIKVEDGFQLWSDIFDHKLEGIFVIQSEIAEKIIESLKVELSPEEREQIQKKPTDNLEAYNLYLRGRWLWSKRTQKDMESSIKYFEQAVESDSDYALAYVGLADAYMTLADWEFFHPRQAYIKSKEAVIKALEIDDSLAEAHSSLGMIKYMYEYDWITAEEEFKRAITLNPNYGAARQEYGEFLACLGRFDESVKQIKQAQRIDPLSLMFRAIENLPVYLSRDYDKAIDICKKTLEMDPDFRAARYYLGRSYRENGFYEKALEEFRKVNAQTEIGITLAKMGKKQEALHVIKDYLDEIAQSDSPVFFLDVSWIYFAMEEDDQGFLCLNKAIEQQESLRLIKVHPFYDRVRSDPRYKEILKKVGLE